MIEDAEGNLYGTTNLGGATGNGIVYKLDKTRKLTILYSFTMGADGGRPEAGLVQDASGNLYGTTVFGGDLACDGGIGCGTIFKLSPSGQETVLHNFEGTPGEFPAARLVMDAAGDLYGTTPGNDSSNYGSVFKLEPLDWFSRIGVSILLCTRPDLFLRMGRVRTTVRHSSRSSLHGFMER